MADLALGPTEVGLLALLDVAAMQAVATGGVYTAVPQSPTYPLLWFEVDELSDQRGLGTGGLPEVRIRLHALSLYEGNTEVDAILKVGIGLLKDQSVTVDGYRHCGLIFYDGAVRLGRQDLAGQMVTESVALLRAYLEEE